MRCSTAVMVCALSTVAFQGLASKAEANASPSVPPLQLEPTDVVELNSFTDPDPIAAVSLPEFSHDPAIALIRTHAAAQSPTLKSLEIAQADISTLTNTPVETVQINTIRQPPTLELPKGFKLPMGISVATERSIQTNTPITDKFISLSLGDRALSKTEYTGQINTWAEQIRECMLQTPQLVSIQTDGTLIPIVFNGNQGKVVSNANQRLVCTS